MDKNNCGEYLAPGIKVITIGLSQTLLQDSQHSAIEQSLENDEIDW